MIFLLLFYFLFPWILVRLSNGHLFFFSSSFYLISQKLLYSPPQIFPWIQDNPHHTCIFFFYTSGHFLTSPSLFIFKYWCDSRLGLSCFPHKANLSTFSAQTISSTLSGFRYCLYTYMVAYELQTLSLGPGVIALW